VLLSFNRGGDGAKNPCHSVSRTVQHHYLSSGFIICRTFNV